MDLWAAIPELSVDAGPVTQAQPERVRAERAAPAPAARRVEALMSGICTTLAQESALEAYNSGRRAAAGGGWRTFLLAPSHDTECSLLAPAAAADKAHAALLAVRQRQMLVYALHGRLGRESPAFALPFDLARMVDEWMPVLPCADTLRRYLEQGVHNEAARLDAAAAAMHIRPVNPTLAFWADEETRYALERMAGKRARNTRWAELSQRRAHLATGTQRWPPRKDASGNAAPEGEEGREQETPRGELRWPERDERMLSFGRCEAGATTPKWGVSTTRRYAIGAEYRSLVTEFLERHAQSFVQVEFELDWTDPTGSEGGAEGPEGQEVAAGVEGRALLPTVRALDQSGAKVECFRPRRVHIDGWWHQPSFSSFIYTFHAIYSYII